jgi:hypothetical protein
MKFLLVLLCLITSAALAEESRHRILGLSAPEREPDLREAMKAIPEVQLADLDHNKAEVTLRYDCIALFPNHNPERPLKPEDIEKRLDEKLRAATQGSFSLRPLCTLSPDKLEQLSIKIVIPDCKGCRLGTCNSNAKIDGVELVRLSADFSEVIAWIDPDKTNREKLIEKMKKDRIELPTP